MLRAILFCLALTAVAAAQTVNYTISTVAGIGRPPGDNGPAIAALLNAPGGVATDSAGNVYFAEGDSHRIRKVDSAGRIATIAGTGDRGYSGDGGPALFAKLIQPLGIAVDASGAVYFTDVSAHVVRRITPDGFISTVAGKGTRGFSGDGSQATAAQLNTPVAVAVFGGALYIADTGNNRVRRVAANGVISTIIGTGQNAGSRAGGPGPSIPVAQPDGLAFDAAGTLYISEFGLGRVLKADTALNVAPIAGSAQLGEGGDGGPALLATLNGPSGLAVDVAGAVYVADEDGNRIRKIAGGTINSVAGTGTFGFSGDGGNPLAAQLNSPIGLAIDSAGRLYVGDSSNHRIRRVDQTAATITTFAGGFGVLGDSGPATAALLFGPAGMAFDAAGNLYIADGSNHRIRKVTVAGVIATVAGTGSVGFSGDGGDAKAAQLNNPQGVAVDAAGNLLIADTNNNRVRRVNQSGVIQTVAGNGMDSFSGDGGAATSATLSIPNAITVDAQGSLYIADSGNDRIRRVNVSGQISTYAGSNATALGDDGPAVSASLSLPLGVALDAAGNLFIADTLNQRIRRVTPAGVISTVAGNGEIGFAGDGGAATQASLSLPFGVATDAAGNLYIADGANGRVRQVSAVGTIRTIAGNGSLAFGGDGGMALFAQLGFIGGIAVDASGAVYTSDQDNHRVRKLTPFVVPADFTFTATSDTAIRLTLASLNNFAGTIQLGVKTAGINLPALTPVTLAAGKSATVTVPAFTIPAGITQITFTADSGTLHREATVAVGSPAPVISAAAIANAASFLAGPVAPGELITIYGAGMGSPTLTTLALDANGKVATTLAGTTVRFDNRPAPLIYVSATQLSAIVPYGVSGSARLQVTYNEVTSNTVTVAVSAAAPALFTVNSAGTGQVAALNQDGSLNSSANPAAKGSVVVLYGTGEGETDPAGVDGQLAASVYPKPVLPVTVSVDGQAAQVLYAGAAPGQVAGVLQINVKVPEGAGSGLVPVAISVGTQTSPSQGVSISVK